MYHNGSAQGTQYLTTNENRAPGSGNVVIGSDIAAQHPSFLEPGASTTLAPFPYGSLVMDELTMWNRELSADSVAQIYNKET